ncbi:hypothetical protein H6F67_14040 [Microcoleus sp. FACHB-1515]|uniref:hypothetical protein n=1 Tax=Cyanophyceae TaxID=3028117 RepID=UPI0016850CC0|nr:hypothetical protein [Microcoleus sp. FACHB-1515]MBD2090972.1 hypothetical protein [Microcoleus sp. FACHB-1515]
MKPFKLESLGRVIRLTIAAYVFGVGLVAIIFWNLLFLWMIFFFSQPIGSLPILLLPIAAFGLGLISFWFVRIIYNLLLKIFWSEPPSWLSVGGLRSGFKTYLEVLLLMLPIALLWFLHVGFTGVLEEQTMTDYRVVAPPDFMGRWFWLFLLFAVAYCHFTRKHQPANHR